VDRAKIDNIKQLFKTPSELANRVQKVELSKDGVFDVKILSASETSIPFNEESSIPSYTVEYRVDSSRGVNHYLSRSVVTPEKKLIVSTVQAKEEDYMNTEIDVKENAQLMINSFTLINTENI
jgi:alpha-L-arabinofuranosidase